METRKGMGRPSRTFLRGVLALLPALVIGLICGEWLCGLADEGVLFLLYDSRLSSVFFRAVDAAPWCEDYVCNGASTGVYVLAYCLPSVITFAWLNRKEVTRVRESLCRGCKTVLRGLREPRCPKCEEWI